MCIRALEIEYQSHDTEFSVKVDLNKAKEKERADLREP